MTAVYVAIVAGIVVAAIYLWSVTNGLVAARTEMATFGGGQLGQIQTVPDRLLKEQERGLIWQSAAGVVLSTLALVLLVIGPVFWTLVPFLAIGTAITVIVAFAIESRARKTGVGQNLTTPKLVN
jgi:hypothetical protein